MNVSPSNVPSSNGSERASPCSQPDLLRRAGESHALLPDLEHLGALVDADDVAVLLPRELERDRCGAGGDVEHRVERPHVEPRDEEPAPARVLPERQDARPAVVVGPERREEGRWHPYAWSSMALDDDLERIAGAAAAHGQVTAVLAAEPASGAAALPRRARRRTSARGGSCSTTPGAVVDAARRGARHGVDRRDVRARRGSRRRRRPRAAARASSHACAWSSSRPGSRRRRRLRSRSSGCSARRRASPRRPSSTRSARRRVALERALGETVVAVLGGDSRRRPARSTSSCARSSGTTASPCA